MPSKSRPVTTYQSSRTDGHYKRLPRFLNAAVIWSAVTATILGVLLIPDRTVLGVALAIVGCIVVKAAGRAS